VDTLRVAADQAIIRVAPGVVTHKAAEETKAVPAAIPRAVTPKPVAKTKEAPVAIPGAVDHRMAAAPMPVVAAPGTIMQKEAEPVVLPMEEPVAPEVINTQ